MKAKCVCGCGRLGADGRDGPYIISAHCWKAWCHKTSHTETLIEWVARRARLTERRRCVAAVEDVLRTARTANEADKILVAIRSGR